MKSKTLVGLFALPAFIWGWVVLDGSLIFAFLKSIYAAPFWVYPVFLLIDFIWSALGKNQKEVNNFYKGLSIDLLGIVGGYVILFTIYYFDGVKYTASGIDTAATGLPLLVVAICRLYSTSRLKIDGKPVRKAIFYYSLVTILLFLSLSSVVLLETSKGNLDFYHAL